MRIQSLEIHNYKSFLDSQIVNLEAGFNLLVGSNNSGKTNVLSLLELPAGFDDRHRSTKTIPEFGGINTSPPQVSASIITTLPELHRLLGTATFQFPIPNNVGNIRDILTNAYECKDEIQINYNLSSQIYARIERPINLELIANQPGALAALTGQEIKSFQIMTSGNTFAVSWEWLSSFRKLIYRFGAERRPAARTFDTSSSLLKSDGGNLAFCINHLQTSDSQGHKLLCELVNRVFPEVQWVQSIPVGSEFIIQCLPEPPSGRRQDLARPLDAMGTGLGNVISMLYVLLTSRHPQVIAIDEPNAFLHPRALRELFTILEEYGPDHQFVISAHSPDVLTSVRPATITLLNLNDGSTKVRQARYDQIRTLSGDLSEMGIRMTDLHSRDRVLWVEGQTEEIVIPMLIKKRLPKIAASTAVLRVEHTGTFDRRGGDVVEICKIYTRLSQSSGLVPPSVGMLLDSEKRSENIKKEIESKSGGQIRFLKEQMLENYVLKDNAIHGVLTALCESVSPEQVTSELKKGLDLNLNAAQILSKIFDDLSSARHSYRKTIHTPMLFEWMIMNNEAGLESLFLELEQLF